MQTLNLLFVLSLLWLTPCTGQATDGTSWLATRPAAWAYDPGPDIDTQKDLIDLHAKIPNFPAISLQIMRYRYSKPQQKFRPAYGAIPWRMILKPNHVKILFIGQDGTHIAEAANRPGTAGFGGRAHSLAAYFGVEYSAAFINAYAFTIKGQYSARGVPHVYKGKLSTSRAIVPNDIWLMTQDQDSPITQWRNDLIEWIINNNRQSLKLIVLFGGAAKDSIASFIVSRGGKVGSHFEHKMDEVQVPEFYLVSAGGNNEFPVPYDKHGRDAYRRLLGDRPRYSHPDTAAQINTYLKDNHDKAIRTMVFSRAGPYNNGLLHHAQLGGYDLNKIWVKREHARNHKPTRSLKGLQLKKGGTIKNHILVLALPHPTSLSHTKNNAAMRHWLQELKQLDNFAKLAAKINRAPSYKKLDAMTGVLDELPDRNLAKKIRAAGYAHGNAKVAALVERDVAKIRSYLNRGWHISPDPSPANAKYPNENRFAQGKQYRYGREAIHPVYYDFGTPKNRMLSSSTARRGQHKEQGGGRRSRGSQIIIFGSRDVPAYDYKSMDQMLAQQPNQALDARETFITGVMRSDQRYQFDPGPPAEYAQLLHAISSTYKSLYAPKRGMSFSQDGIAAYHIKTHPRIGAFGHYRGTFANPQVVILADPDGVDDIVTARALTGTRGQYLHGMMEDLEVGDRYLVIKTVPFGMDGATQQDWQRVYQLTQKWRAKLLQEILANTYPDWLMADGTWAQKTLADLFQQASFATQYGDKYVPISREGQGNGSGIRAAVKSMAVSVRYRARMSNIPRSHLTYYARAWEGTSGDRVLDSKDRTSDRYQGLAFQVVVPNWVVKQKHTLDPIDQKAVDKMKAKLRRGGFSLPYESIPDFLERTHTDDEPVNEAA